MIKLIPLLTDPAAHGGRTEDSFDVVVLLGQETELLELVCAEKADVRVLNLIKQFLQTRLPREQSPLEYASAALNPSVSRHL
jgi:hypothetical protein